jgi:hypothetical protein
VGLAVAITVRLKRKPTSKEDAAARSALWRAMRRFPFREPDFKSRPIAAKAAFLLLLAASAVFGVMIGLMLVYSINLPQMADLERYHPSTTTELYDVHGRVFGSFALERRIVVPYSEFPPVLREAIFSIEDKNFENNGGINLIRVSGCAFAWEGSGCEYADDAAGAKPVSVVGEDVRTEGAGDCAGAAD